MDINQQSIEESLSLLASLIDGQPPLHFVICGDSSLLALGMVSRETTRDVDVLALLDQGRIITAKPLPEYILVAAEQVRKEMNLMEGWFNTGPSDDSFFRFGLPEGLADRLTTREYGPSLTISYIGRIDQIHLKLYAAADQGPTPSRHSNDLRDLTPTSDELLQAAQWCLLHDESEGFRMLLKATLTELGHESVHQAL